MLQHFFQDHELLHLLWKVAFYILFFGSAIYVAKRLMKPFEHIGPHFYKGATQPDPRYYNYNGIEILDRFFGNVVGAHPDDPRK
jgi:hypothetical protein